MSALYDFGKGTNNVFITISKGYRSGGYNTQIFSDILQNKMMNGLMGDLGVYLDNAPAEMDAESTAYRPEKSWNFEAGGHFDKWIGSGHLSGSASAFYILCRDQQITIFPPGMSTGRMMANVGRSKSIGAEATLSYGYKGLSLSAAYGYTDAHFTSYDDGNNDFSGNHIPYSPEHTLNFRVGYIFPLTNSSIVRNISMNADCSGIGRIWWDEANQFAEPFVAQVGADILVAFHWFDLRFRMDNILNEDYNVFYFKSVGNHFFQRGKPLRWNIGINISL